MKVHFAINLNTKGVREENILNNTRDAISQNQIVIGKMTCCS
jgi:hypothetical protein